MRENLEFGYYLVAFIDVLNQKEAMRKFKKLPTNPEERLELIEAAKRTFGVVDLIRREFDEYKTQYMQKQKPLRPLTGEPLQIFNAMQDCKIQIQQLADTVVVYVAFSRDANEVPLFGVHSVLVACAAVVMCSLSERLALRGGIELGVAAEMNEGEIYGPALYEAYRLEREVAQYPRIVIGNGLVEFLGLTKAVQSSDFLARTNKMLAENCLELFAPDVDGHQILDYLGKGFSEISEWTDDGVLSNIQAFVAEQVAIHKQTQNTKLAFRYALLNDYVLSRLPLWQEGATGGS